MPTKKLSDALIIGLQMSLCGLICFFISQYFHFSEGFWSVVTVSAITRPFFSATFVKAGLRLFGTLFGATVGFIMAEWIGFSPILLFLAILIFSTVTVYIGLQTKPYNYLSIVAGFSATIVIQSFLLDNIRSIALYRTLEVCIGIIVMSLVSWILSKFFSSQTHLFDKDTAKKIHRVFRTIHFSKVDLFNALLISLTISVTFIFWILFRYPQGVWLTITLFVIMEDTIAETQSKSLARLLGQIFAAVLGGTVAVFFPSNMPIIALVLVVGFFICGTVIGYESRFSASGNHAGSALAIMLLAGLPDNSAEVVINRFINVVAAIVIAMTVSYFQLISKPKL
ncbi:FUSC family protein [Legionella waltersii]|uniref:Fusaric acid resistance protein family protein n=1 Tax=Legionella waltersii TaxID=66969 RepID=A0A0W1A176_9GAMM|nr:FUSC family protein [Legionella waltersii]KTD75082.1 Fusaric acid resistance protein family protein [Legionella waltersii]SNV05202.1 Predicted membrane protein [Legionella waltersii]